MIETVEHIAGPLAATVPVADLKRRLRAPDDGSGQMLAEFARNLGVQLDVTEGWDGRACVPVDQAAAMVSAYTARIAERQQAKAEAQRRRDAERFTADTEITGKASRAYYVALLNAHMGYSKNPELEAWSAGWSVVYGDAEPPSAEAAEAAYRQLVDGGVLPKPKRRGLFG